eukprot:248231_1
MADEWTDDEDEDKIGFEDKCCCCSVYGGFYIYSTYYLLVSIILIWIFVAQINNDVDHQGFFITATFLYALGRLIVSILGFVCTRQLSNRGIPSECMIDFWSSLALWIPVVGNVIVMTISVGLFVIIYAVRLHVPGDDENIDAIIHLAGSTFFFYLLLIIVPFIIDTSIAIAFYLEIRGFIEKSRLYKLYACAPCVCC